VSILDLPLELMRINRN